ncbi:MAG: pyridoxal phosphate-dependent aminotransferase [Rickettsiaceae bacterium]|nr:pyridoxal phosphate-dependent aminotransferase [Rickettsiaceae bacterium]
MKVISGRVTKIKLSPTLAFNARAANLKKLGKDIISLTVGEPDFDTPQNIKKSAIRAINDGKTKYTDVDGVSLLKEAVINKLRRENGLDYELNQITICAGGKQVIYNLFMASLDEGDEVIIPSPYWASYPDIVTIAGGKPIIVDCPIEHGLKLNAYALLSNISAKTKWLILNSPCNPTGALYSYDELASIGEILRQNHNIYVLSDDIYEHLIFDSSKFFNILNVCPDLKERVFIVNGVSKSYAMTGWRIGYGAGGANLISSMSIIQSQSTSNPCSISQYAAIEALNGPQDFIASNTKEFEAKRDLALEILATIDNISCTKPLGAFYLFPYIGHFLNTKTPSGNLINNSFDFSMYLLEEVGVAVVPGSSFGAEGFIRLSTAVSRDNIREGILRIKDACSKLISK